MSDGLLSRGLTIRDDRLHNDDLSDGHGLKSDDGQSRDGHGRDHRHQHHLRVYDHPPYSPHRTSRRDG